MFSTNFRAKEKYCEEMSYTTSRSIWTMFSDTQSDFLCVQKLDTMILVGLFQLRIFYDHIYLIKLGIFNSLKNLISDS